jgi:transmembrane sensor
MPSSLAYYQQLLEKYINNQCTPQEAEELFEFLQQDASGKVLLEQLQNEFNRTMQENEHVPPEISKNIRNRLIDFIRQTKDEPFYKRPFFRVAAAASIVAVLCGGSYFFFLHNPKRQPVTTTTNESLYKNDVAPGGNRAVLTLGDGSTIILDSAQNGSLAQQGNTTVMKLNNGQLVYNVGKSDSQEIIYNTLSTPRGGQYQITLADGTGVWLNAASSIKFPTKFIGNERKVAITGEVYFEASLSNSAGGGVKQPFIVNILPSTGGAGGGRVEVLGTHFNINAYDDEAAMKVTLLEGSIKVLGIQKPVSSILKPGQQAQLNNERIQVVNGADLNEVMAWKNGQFYFDEADIKTVMRQVEKWYNVEVNYEADISYSFVAEISRDVNVSKLLHILELTDLVHFKIEGNKITVMK